MFKFLMFMAILGGGTIALLNSCVDQFHHAKATHMEQMINAEGG